MPALASPKWEAPAIAQVAFADGDGAKMAEALIVTR
jgi:hypothetical protein